MAQTKLDKQLKNFEISGICLGYILLTVQKTRGYFAANEPLF